MLAALFNAPLFWFNLPMNGPMQRRVARYDTSAPDGERP